MPLCERTNVYEPEITYPPFLTSLLEVARGQHPTAVTSIVNSNQDTTLEVNHNGSLLAPGALISDGTENDSIPATGAGTHLMWYPAKAAFRAGHVNGSQWDASNVRAYSVALGRDTKAAGDASVAMGLDATAKGTAAMALGAWTTTSIEFAAALGTETKAATRYSLSVGVCNSANTSGDSSLFVV